MRIYELQFGADAPQLHFPEQTVHIIFAILYPDPEEPINTCLSLKSLHA